MALKALLVAVLGVAVSARPESFPSYRAPAPAPTYRAPAPVPTYNAPAPTPTYSAPAPTYNAPAPTYNAPAPAPIYSAPVQQTPAKYDFNWAVKDDYSGNDFGHQESRDGYDTQGSYYVQLPDGRLQRVSYTVNGDSGYVAQVTYEGEAQYPAAPQPSYTPAPTYQPPQTYA